MVIGISGKIGSGKDTVGKIIQYLTYFKGANNLNEKQTFKHLLQEGYIEGFGEMEWLGRQGWQIKKYADKLKDITCILLNCTREDLENREFKETPLGEEWDFLRETNSYGADDVIYSVDYKGLTHIVHTTKESLTPRKVLQLLGTDCIRNKIHPDAWVNALMNEYKPKYLSIAKQIIIDKGRKGYTGIKELTLELRKLTSKEILSKYPYVSLNYPNWIITDVRFPNELKAIKDRGGITIRVNRDSNKLGKKDCGCGEGLCIYVGTPVECKFKSRLEVVEHSSETALDNSEHDYTVDNNGSIEDLIEEIKIILTKENLL